MYWNKLLKFRKGTYKLTNQIKQLPEPKIMSNTEAITKLENLNNMKYGPPSLEAKFSKDINSAYNLYNSKQITKLVNDDSNYYYLA